MAWLKDAGYSPWPVQLSIVARGMTIRRDLFGIIDIVALHPSKDGLLGVQACGGAGDAVEHRKKLKAHPMARLWVEAGLELHLHIWTKHKPAGSANFKWTLEAERIAVE